MLDIGTLFRAAKANQGPARWFAHHLEHSIVRSDGHSDAKKSKFHPLLRRSHWRSANRAFAGDDRNICAAVIRPTRKLQHAKTASDRRQHVVMKWYSGFVLWAISVRWNSQHFQCAHHLAAMLLRCQAGVRRAAAQGHRRDGDDHSSRSQTYGARRNCQRAACLRISAGPHPGERRTSSRRFRCRASLSCRP